jgi:hypothetical protein
MDELAGDADREQRAARLDGVAGEGVGLADHACDRDGYAPIGLAWPVHHGARDRRREPVFPVQLGGPDDEAQVLAGLGRELDATTVGMVVAGVGVLALLLLLRPDEPAPAVPC